ncbi:CCCH-type Zn-finger protein [Phaffia rhodozyma]|uniref:CCCH-type Zn-finger protein n=1 Tax=Phaffia rhodozyma TaxID=264483 RepID=A0A0F7SWN2_PHARH|nr:CCCH-type Zn-finger protein [Phaffia rhodozyma]
MDYISNHVDQPSLEILEGCAPLVPCRTPCLITAAEIDTKIQLKDCSEKEGGSPESLATKTKSDHEDVSARRTRGLSSSRWAPGNSPSTINASQVRRITVVPSPQRNAYEIAAGHQYSTTASTTRSTAIQQATDHDISNFPTPSSVPGWVEESVLSGQYQTTPISTDYDFLRSLGDAHLSQQYRQIGSAMIWESSGRDISSIIDLGSRSITSDPYFSDDRWSSQPSHCPTVPFNHDINKFEIASDEEPKSLRDIQRQAVLLQQQISRRQQQQKNLQSNLRLFQPSAYQLRSIHTENSPNSLAVPTFLDSDKQDQTRQPDYGSNETNPAPFPSGSMFALNQKLGKTFVSDPGNSKEEVGGDGDFVVSPSTSTFFSNLTHTTTSMLAYDPDGRPSHGFSSGPSPPSSVATNKSELLTRFQAIQHLHPGVFGIHKDDGANNSLEDNYLPSLETSILGLNGQRVPSGRGLAIEGPLTPLASLIGTTGLGHGINPIVMDPALQRYLLDHGLPLDGPSPTNKKAKLYKTELCRTWERNTNARTAEERCQYGNKCQYAHGTEEIRPVDRHPKYKTQICTVFWLFGRCAYGRRCCFLHNDIPVGGIPELGELGTPAALRDILRARMALNGNESIVSGINTPEIASSRAQPYFQPSTKDVTQDLSPVSALGRHSPLGYQHHRASTYPTTISSSANTRGPSGLNVALSPVDYRSGMMRQRDRSDSLTVNSYPIPELISTPPGSRHMNGIIDQGRTSPIDSWGPRTYPGNSLQQPRPSSSSSSNEGAPGHSVLSSGHRIQTSSLPVGQGLCDSIHAPQQGRPIAPYSTWIFDDNSQRPMSANSSSPQGQSGIW